MSFSSNPDMSAVTLTPIVGSFCISSNALATDSLVNFSIILYVNPSASGTFTVIPRVFFTTLTVLLTL